MKEQINITTRVVVFTREFNYVPSHMLFSFSRLSTNKLSSVTAFYVDIKSNYIHPIRASLIINNVLTQSLAVYIGPLLLRSCSASGYSSEQSCGSL